MMGIMESIGDGLVVEPFLSTVMGAQFVARGGSEAGAVTRPVTRGFRRTRC